MLKSALDRNHSSSGGTGGGLATQQYVQKSKSLLLKSGERVERLPLTTFATANGAHLGTLGGNAADGGEEFDADDALFAEMEVGNSIGHFSGGGRNSLALHAISVARVGK